jgi:hypothetical protein
VVAAPVRSLLTADGFSVLHGEVGHIELTRLRFNVNIVQGPSDGPTMKVVKAVLPSPGQTKSELEALGQCLCQRKYRTNADLYQIL